MIAQGRVGPPGEVVAVDVRSFDPIPGVRFVRGVVGDPELPGRLGPNAFDVVLSDMSPRISGAYATDHARSVELVTAAFDLARVVLRPGGCWVAKVFDGDLLEGMETRVRPHFDRLVRTKPAASRERSSELYLLGFGFRPLSVDAVGRATA